MTAKQAYKEDDGDGFVMPCPKCKKYPPVYSPGKVIFHPNKTHVRISYQCDEQHRWTRWERFRMFKDKQTGKTIKMFTPSRKPKH